MMPQSRGRTAVTLIAAMLIVAINTLFSVAFDRYSAWFAWVVLALTVALIVVALRFQQRLTLATTLLLMTVPIIVATVGVIVGV